MTLDRKQHPAFNRIEHIHFPVTEKIILDNAIPVHIINGGTQEVLKLDVIVAAGAVFAPKRIMAPIAGLMLNEGTRNKTAHNIAEIFDFFGAYFQPTIEKDMANFSLISTSKHFKEVMPVFSEIFFQSTFPQHELDLLLERRRQKFLVEREKTSFMARELFNSHVFGSNHPYGFPSSESDYSALSRTELVDFYTANYNPANMEIIISGRVTDANLQLINKLLGAVKVQQKLAIPELPPNLVTQFDPIFMEKSDAVQSSIRLGMQTINKLHPDYLGLKVLITVLGGYFGSRLMKNIREDKGYTYGVHAMLVSLMNIGYFGVAADVKAENTQQAIDEIKKEMDKLRNEPITDRELLLVKSYMMGEMLQMFDGPFATSDSYKNVLPYKMGFEYYEKMKRTILDITSEQLLQLANRYFNTEKLVVAAVGKMQ